MCPKKIYGLLLYFILSSAGLFAQSDSILFPFISTLHSEDVQGKYLMDASPYAFIIDDQGTPVYQQQFLGGIRNFTPLNDTSFAVYCYQIKAFLILDAQMLPADTVHMSGEYEVDFHHISMHKNGNMILVGRELRSIDMSATVWTGSPDATISGAVIQEFDQEKNLLYEWKSLDHIGIGDTLTCLVDPLAQSIDYIHVNSVQPDSDSTWIVSCRNLDQVIKIHKEKGEILWHLGGEKNQFEFTNDSHRFSAQHSVQLHENGDLSLFDNGNCKTAKISRALVYSLNQEEKTISLSRELIHAPPLYAPIMGNYNLLPGGQSLVGWGRNRDKIVFSRYQEEFVQLEMAFTDEYALYPYAVYPTEWCSPIEIINKGSLNPGIINLGDSLWLDVEFHNTTDYEARPLGLHFKGAEVAFLNTFANPLAPGETRLMKVQCIPEKTGNFESSLTAYFRYGSASFAPIGGSQIRLDLNVWGPSDIANFHSRNASIRLFPNPAKDMLTINLQEALDGLNIYSISGVLQMEVGQKDIGTHKVQISELSAGTYFILGTSRSGNMVKGRFIKMD